MGLVWLGVQFADPQHGTLPGEAWNWWADHDPEAAARLRERNRRVAAALAAHRELELEPVQDGLDPDAVEMVTGGERLPRSVVLGRLDRLHHWHGAGPFAAFDLWLADGSAELSAAMRSASPRDRDAAAAAIDAIAAVLAGAGLVAWDVAANRPLAHPVGETALAAAGGGLERAARQERRLSLMRAAGPAVAVVLTLAALAGGAVLVDGALQSGRVAGFARTSAPATFETERALPIERVWGVLPRYALAGHVGAAVFVLPVPRDAYIRAAPGARYSVVPTGEATHPYILLARSAGTGPLLPLGQGRAMPVAALVLLGALALVWWLGVGRPVRAHLAGRPGALVQVSRFGLQLLQVGAGIALILALRTLL